MNHIGIDLGGTKIEGILLNSSGTELNRNRIPTLRDQGYDSILNRIISLVQSLIPNEEQELSIGVCTPGVISPATGVMKNSNTQCLIGKPLKEDLENSLNQNIYMENDANCFALAEALLGAAKGNDSVFGVIMGTGVGGGIIFNRQIHRGRHFIAGEWGHHTLIKNGRDCYCGNKGCVESYISGPALEKEWKEETGEPKILKDIIPLYNNKDYRDTYLKWKGRFLNHFGQALSNIINIFDPEAIVLGGGLSNIDFLYDEGKQSVYDQVFSDVIDTPILKNKLGDSAGVFGAALLGEIG
ncbi:MAG: sugar kinase [Candidatus Marinimicrobia bacterium]|nr:sugar kinase [Candidatus Neomarinimicrobiota bacterium]|tara:strand:+ start:61233 stop:62126 length:894 start_codon:yes stop_codon:yes gene_type:complete